MTIDLELPAQTMAKLVDGISDEQLDAPTPCDIPLGALLSHVGGLVIVFTGAATRDSDASSRSASPDASTLADDWRTRIPRDLTALAAAWRAPEAWSGITTAGGNDIPAEVAGLIALDELVLHGWDVARATGQSYHCDIASLEAAYGFVAPFAEPGMEAQRQGLFGPVVDVPETAPMLDRLLGLAGRNPDWSPT